MIKMWKSWPLGAKIMVVVTLASFAIVAIDTALDGGNAMAVIGPLLVFAAFIGMGFAMHKAGEVVGLSIEERRLKQWRRARTARAVLPWNWLHALSYKKPKDWDPSA